MRGSIVFVGLKMTFQNSRRLAPFLLLVVLAGACGGVVDPSENTVETFPGTLQPLGTEGHPFRVDKNGEIDVRITALSNPDAILQLVYGRGSCTSLAPLNSGFRQLNQVGIGGLVSPGDHCVVITDSAAVLRQPATYTITVSHP
jgi:hypothetical protein